MARRGRREEWIRKYDQLQGLKALRETHEAMPEPDYEYLLKLKERIRRVRSQLDAMSDVGNENVGVSSESE